MEETRRLFFSFLGAGGATGVEGEKRALRMGSNFGSRALQSGTSFFGAHGGQREAIERERARERELLLLPQFTTE